MHYTIFALHARLSGVKTSINCCIFAGNGRVEFGEFTHMMRKSERESTMWQKYKTEEQEHMRHAFKVRTRPRSKST